MYCVCIATSKWPKVCFFNGAQKIFQIIFSQQLSLHSPTTPLCLPLSCFLHKLFALDREKSGTKSNDAGGVVLSPFKVGKSIPISKYSCLGLKYSYLRVLPMLPHCLKFSCPIQATAANPKMDNVWKKSLIV